MNSIYIFLNFVIRLFLEIYDVLIDPEPIEKIKSMQLDFTIFFRDGIKILLLILLIPKRATKSHITKLLTGGEIGIFKINNHDLSGLNVDYNFVQKELSRWKSKTKAEQQVVFTTQFKFFEVIVKEVANFVDSVIRSRTVDTCISLFEQYNLVSTEIICGMRSFNRYRNYIFHDTGSKFSSKVAYNHIKQSQQSLNTLLQSFVSISGLH